MTSPNRWMVGLVAAGLSATVVLGAQAQRQRAADALAEPFVGVTADGEVETDLFAISATGVSTQPVIVAARQFLGTLDDDQRERTSFAADSIEWRDWHNIHRYERKGVARWEMSEEQETAALELLRASLSVRGFANARDIMRLNEDHPRTDGALGRVRRGALSLHRHGRAVGDRAVGMATGRTPPRHQLLRARRPGRHDADVHGLRAGRGRGRQVRRHPGVRTGRGEGSGSRRSH